MLSENQISKITVLALFLFSSLVLSSFRDAPTPAEVFMNKSSAFIKKNYASDYNYSDETVRYQGMFERIAEADWAGTVTLKSKQTYHAAGKKPFHKRLFYSFYYYDDTAKISICYDSLVHCFPPGCYEVHAGKEVQNMTNMASIYILNRHSLITLQIDCPELPGNWDAIKTSLIKDFRENHSTTIVTECGGTLSWKIIP